MKFLFAMSFLATLLSACASTSPKEKEAAAGVKVIDVSFLNGDGKSCRKMGRVGGDSVGASGGQSSAIEDMQVDALRAGGNIVVSNMAFQRVPGLMVPAERVSGIAFRCPHAIWAKVISIDELANP